MRWNKKLVRFCDGTYGVRFGFIFHTYLDLHAPIYDWSMNDPFFGSCKGDEEKARLLYDRDLVEVIK